MQIENNQCSTTQKIMEEAKKVINIGKKQGLTAKDIAQKSLMKVNGISIDEKYKYAPETKEFKTLILLDLLKTRKENGQLIFDDGTSLKIENIN